MTKRRSGRSRGRDGSRKAPVQLQKKSPFLPQGTEGEEKVDCSQKEVSVPEELVEKKGSEEWVGYFDPEEQGLWCQQHPKESIVRISDRISFCRACFQVLGLQEESFLQQGGKRGFLHRLLKR